MAKIPYGDIGHVGQNSKNAKKNNRTKCDQLLILQSHVGQKFKTCVEVLDPKEPNMPHLNG
jgi:hypothetical protein